MYAVEYDEWGDVVNFILDDGGQLQEFYDLKHVGGRIARGEERPFHKKAKLTNQRCIHRARALGAPYESLALLLEEMFEDSVDRGCYWCGSAFKDEHDMTVDHKVPLKQGGPHSSRNVVIACHACNQLRNEVGELALLDPLCIPYNPIAELRFVPQPI